MATKKRTTPLKAKTARRVAPKPRTVPCKIRTAMIGAGTGIRHYNALCAAWRKAATNSTREKELADYCRAVRDEFTGTFETISHLYPNSAEGALYLLMVGYADAVSLHTITDNDLRGERRRRCERCLYKALSYLQDKYGGGIDTIVKGWLAPYSETQLHHRHWGVAEARSLIMVSQEGGAA
jgi:hypothetical protein